MKTIAAVSEATSGACLGPRHAELAAAVGGVASGGAPTERCAVHCGFEIDLGHALPVADGTPSSLTRPLACRGV